MSEKEERGGEDRRRKDKEKGRRRKEGSQYEEVRKVLYLLEKYGNFTLEQDTTIMANGA